jgi:hypothetical protein
MPTPQQTIRAQFNNVNTGLDANEADQATQIIIETLRTSKAARAAVLRLPDLERQEAQLWQRYQDKGERTFVRNDDGIITSVNFARTNDGGGIERTSMAPADVASLNEITTNKEITMAALRGEIMNGANGKYTPGDMAYRVTLGMSKRGITTPQFLRDIASQPKTSLEKSATGLGTAANAPQSVPLLSTGIKLTASSPEGTLLPERLGDVNPNAGGRGQSPGVTLPNRPL